MPDRSFEHTIGFYEVQTPNGLVVLPLITVTLVQPSGTRVDLPLMFDTGASVTTLRDDLYPLLGVPSWDSGIPLQSETAGGVTPCYRYDTTLELFGKAVNCPVHLMQCQGTRSTLACSVGHRFSTRSALDSGRVPASCTSR